MVESNFTGEISPKAIGAFERQFQLIVQTLDYSAGILLASDEIVEQEGAMFGQTLGHSL